MPIWFPTRATFHGNVLRMFIWFFFKFCLSGTCVDLLEGKGEGREEILTPGKFKCLRFIK